MAKKRLLKNGIKRKSSDSSIEEEYIDVEDGEWDIDGGGKNVDVNGREDMMTRVGVDKGMDIDENVRDNHVKQSKVNLPQQFLSDFIFDFNDEELAAKRTVEMIYNSSLSFAYTYRSLYDAFFNKLEGIKDIDPFLKGLVSVADEVVLMKLLSGKSINIPQNSILINYELIILGFFRNLNDNITMKLLDINGWDNLYDLLILLNNDILIDFCKYLSNIFSINKFDYPTFIKCLNDMKSFINELNGVKYKSRVKNKMRLMDCMNTIDILIKIIDYINNVKSIIILNIINKPEIDGLINIIKYINNDLINNNLLNGVNYDLININSICIKCINIILNGDNLHHILKIELDDEFCINKFNNLYNIYEQNLQKEREQNNEYMKKINIKRDAIQYILLRINEYNDNLAPYFKNPFYIVGLPPQNSTLDNVRKWGRKLKTLLHPDTEQDPEWKSKAEIAFKEASLALDQCNIFINSGKNITCRINNIPPYINHIGILESYYGDLKNENVGKSEDNGDNNTINTTPLPTVMLIPQFDITCNDVKVGSLIINIDTTSINNNITLQLFNKNRWLNIYLLRPTHGDEPITMKIPHYKLFNIMKIQLPDGVIKNKIPNIKVDAIQPIILGTAWKYFIGVQLANDKHTSIIKWKSIYIELSNSNRNNNQLIKLLNTFENAPFIDQNVLQNKLKSNSKTQLENYLIECTKLAQKWADNN